MRALFATAVACLAVAACDRADPLPPGMASRITATGGGFSLAVPERWSDVTASAPMAQNLLGFDHMLVVAPAPVTADRWGLPATVYVQVGWGPPREYGTLNCCHGPSVFIAGEPVYGGGDDSSSIVAQFTRTLDGQAVMFNTDCSPTVPKDTCLAILNDWRWETPSSSRVLPVVAEAAGAVALASGAVVLVVVRRRRRTTRP
jgi:hypothetical protein